MTKVISEAQFQDDIRTWLTNPLTAGGYTAGRQEDYDRTRALDTTQLFGFLADTQKQEWELLVARHGGDEATARTKFLTRLSAQLKTKGTITVLRDGVEDQRVQLRLAYFQPATAMNPELASKHAANRLTVNTELRYAAAHDNRLDLALFLNGLPVATAELKNPLNGQGVDHAIAQYKNDRNPTDLIFAERAVVHFALDPRLAFMSARLAGKDTSFLPFNQGNNEGAGNPPAPPGKYDTHYLWEQVWSRRAWLDILGRFVHQRPDPKTKRPATPLFPRYHQWDAVVKMEAHARTHGAGHKYLCQHSAGSGKSNTIAWLAYRLSTLRDAADTKVFDKVIVITDRRILDEQLRGTVEAMERTSGTVESVKTTGGSKSAQLDTVMRSKASIVMTTVQTFPYVLQLLADAELGSRNYAVLIDEAHSSQTGDAALALKQALGSEVSKALADADELSSVEAHLTALLAAREHQPNLSFFAFTATPKPKTNVLFGTTRPDGTHGPFHLYAMRQAIEEGFILDVLASYVTWDTYYRLLPVNDDKGGEVLEVSKASRELRKVAIAHPDLIAEKARIIVEHVRRHTLHQIGGKAKAMVVTDSRRAAASYKQAIDHYVAQHSYTDVRALVAFSGKVRNDDLSLTGVGSVGGDGQEFTEASMNGHPDTETPARFKGEDPFAPGEYHVLIVAEKYQTGFDEPLLHTMFVDKQLSGVNAVQTLSRLNRIAPGKAGTLVLDFRNDREDVQAEFQKFYKGATALPAEANALTDSRNAVTDDFPVIDVVDVTTATNVYFSQHLARRNQADIYSTLRPAVERYTDLDEEEQRDFKAAADRFVRTYAFLSQVFPDNDPDSERLYVYCRALLQELPDGASGRLQLSSSVVMTHLSLEQNAEGSIALTDTEADPLSPYPGEGLGGGRDGDTDTLSNIITQINQAKGLDLNDTHKLALDQVMETLKQDDDLRPVARSNSYDDFLLEFKKLMIGTLLGVEKSNSALFQALLQDAELREKLGEHYGPEVFAALRNTDPPA